MVKTFFSDDARPRCLIVGGTGSLGKELLSQLYAKWNITVISREELKQQNLKRLYPKVRFVLGDVRDYESIEQSFYRQDVVFNLAALKHVDMAEYNPEECIKINLIGAMNVAKACVNNGVPYCVFSSTDKAVLPINIYGMAKAAAERYYFWQNSTQEVTRFSVFRWGNVIGSRGSVLHSFVDSLKKDGKVHITDPRMTRFWIRLSDAAKFMIDNYEDALPNHPMIPPMKAAPVTKLAETVAAVIGVSSYDVKFTGLRPGEKIHETILSNHEECVRSDNSPLLEHEELVGMIHEVVGG